MTGISAGLPKAGLGKQTRTSQAGVRREQWGRGIERDVEDELVSDQSHPNLVRRPTEQANPQPLSSLPSLTGSY